MKRLTTEEFVAKANKVHNNKYEYSKTEYVTSHIPVKISCPEHGEFEQVPNSHLNGSGCLQCGYGRKSKGMATADFVKRAVEVHGSTYDYSLSDYKNMKTGVDIICKTHGLIKVNPQSHLSGAGCRKCADEANSRNFKFSTDYFKERATLIHEGYYNYDKSVYTKAIEKLTITCPIHGDFEQTAISHLSGHACPGCISSAVCYTNLPTTLYFVKMEHLSIVRYKVGITTKTTLERFITEIRNGMDVEILYEKHYDTGRDAFLEEQRVLKELTDFKAPIQDFLYRNSGITELLSEKCCLSIKEIISNY